MDRRVRRTKKRLREALLGLLCTKSVEDITVSELAIKADINRGTFYTHYRDAEDLLANIENDFLKSSRRSSRTAAAGPGSWTSITRNTSPIMRNTTWFGDFAECAMSG